MTVSLIVCTRNRAARLPAFLERIARLESPPGGWELILVDSASTDESAACLERFAAQAPFPVRCLRASAPGLARARNVGIAQARGRILAFTDDDCYPSPNYLRAFVEVFEEYGVGFVGGRILLYDRSDASVCVKDVGEGFAIPSHRFVSAGTLHGANMAVRREVVQMIGGFDPRLGAGSPCEAGEDIEFLARAVWAGWPGRYDPRPVVEHHHGRKPGADAERQRQAYDFGRGAYYAKFLLHRGARAAYLRAWARRVRNRGLRRSAIARSARELAGAARYLIEHVARREAAPPLAATTAAAPSRPGSTPS